MRFAAEGATVVGCDIDAEGAAETVRLAAAANARLSSLHPWDLSEDGAAARLVDFALQRCGGLDILYNNAGMARFGAVSEMAFEDFSFTVENELGIVFRLVQAAWPHLLAGGGGAIVNSASVSASRVYKVLPAAAHSAAKGGVVAMTRQMAMEGGPHGIRANEVPATAALLEDPAFRVPMVAKLMLPRWGQPRDVAAAAAFLASDDASWITGIDLKVDGGTSAW